MDDRTAGEGGVGGHRAPDGAGGPDGDHDERLTRLRVRSRRIALLYSAAAVALIPWTVYLAVTLPRRDLDTHYRGAWVGFDLFLVAAIVTTAYYAFRMDARVQLPATATATLLVVDAWFDVMTAGPRQPTFEAVLMALCIELPAAGFSLWLARRVNRNAALLASRAPAAPPAG